MSPEKAAPPPKPRNFSAKNPILRCACLVLALGLPLTLQAQFQALPPLNGECLSGRQAALPGEALGRLAVVILSFSRAASEPATRWGKALELEFKSPADPLVYQVALLEAAPRLVRPLILRSMRKKTGPAIQDKFIILKKDTDSWKKTAAYDKNSPDDAYLLLLNRKGEIIWTLKSQGPDKDIQILKEKFAALPGKAE